VPLQSLRGLKPCPFKAYAGWSRAPDTCLDCVPPRWGSAHFLSLPSAYLPQPAQGRRVLGAPVALG